MNWGHKLTVVIGIFILAMLSMVYLAFQQTNDMVDTNYYDKELKYQLKIDAAQNLNAASTEVLVTQYEKNVKILIPKNLTKNFANGKLEFLKSDDKKRDLNLNFQPDTAGQFIIDGKRFVRGLYKVRLQWESEDKSYYREQDLMLE